MKISMKSLTIPCLSVRQPWASFIVAGIKDVENRSWNTSLRGPVFIHASKTFSTKDYEQGKQAYRRIYPFMKREFPPKQAFFTGGIIGIVTITDNVTDHSSPWFTGPVGFVLSTPSFFIPIFCKGQLGFFRVPEEARAKIDALKDVYFF